MEKERERRKKKQPNYSARKVAQNDAQNRPKSCQKNVRNIKERKSYFCSQRRLPKVFRIYPPFSTLTLTRIHISASFFAEVAIFICACAPALILSLCAKKRRIISLQNCNGRENDDIRTSGPRFKARPEKSANLQREERSKNFNSSWSVRACRFLH